MPILTGLDWDEGTAFDVQNKGWYEMACLKMDDGKSIPLSIWDRFLPLNAEMKPKI
jgi:hypothetical protein